VLIIGVDGSADLYDPGTETFARVGSLVSSLQPSYTHTASLRADGTVLAAGGDASVRCRNGVFTGSKDGAALFAPESDGFTVTGSLTTPRDTHTATVLPDGAVLVVGGLYRDFTLTLSLHCYETTGVLSSAELFR
jgi:hypothetical protein